MQKFKFKFGVWICVHHYIITIYHLLLSCDVSVLLVVALEQFISHFITDFTSGIVGESLEHYEQRN